MAKKTQKFNKKYKHIKTANVLRIKTLKLKNTLWFTTDQLKFNSLTLAPNFKIQNFCIIK